MYIAARHRESRIEHERGIKCEHIRESVSAARVRSAAYFQKRVSRLRLPKEARISDFKPDTPAQLLRHLNPSSLPAPPLRISLLATLSAPCSVDWLLKIRL